MYQYQSIASIWRHVNSNIDERSSQIIVLLNKRIQFLFCLSAFLFCLLFCHFASLYLFDGDRQGTKVEWTMCRVRVTWSTLSCRHSSITSQSTGTIMVDRRHRSIVVILSNLTIQEATALTHRLIVDDEGPSFFVNFPRFWLIWIARASVEFPSASLRFLCVPILQRFTFVPFQSPRKGVQER